VLAVLCRILLSLMLALVAGRAAADADVDRILALGPWPPALQHDPSNRVSGQPAAIALGVRLFSSPSLSGAAGIRCATCHEQWRGFVDGRTTGLGAEPGTRNTLPLRNVALNGWFGWDGANDSLWAQSIRPLLDAREMKSSPAHVAAVMRRDADFATLYAQAFDAPLPADDEALLVDVGKALAAYQETLLSGRTAFDDYRDALARGDARAAARYPQAALRGLRVFVGKGQCVSCHAGPNFSDGTFHRSLIASPQPDGTPDTGRQHGLQALLASRFNRLGRYNDDVTRATAQPTREAAAAVASDHAGAFRTPSLREATATGPYMHDGSVENLCDALRPHVAGGVELARDERRDIVAFLRTLSVEASPPHVDERIFKCS
jgi:cytochrome c peroxidase